MTPISPWVAKVAQIALGVWGCLMPGGCQRGDGRFFTRAHYLGVVFRILISGGEMVWAVVARGYFKPDPGECRIEM